MAIRHADEPHLSRPRVQLRQKAIKTSRSHKNKSASQLIDARFKEVGAWRGKMLSRLRALVQKVDPEARRGMAVTRGCGLAARQIDSHGQDLQERREDNLRQRCSPGGPIGFLQFRSLWERKACRRLSRGLKDR